MTNVVSAGMKTIVEPLTMPGSVSGTRMRRSVCHQPAPRSRAASMTLLSIFDSDT